MTIMERFTTTGNAWRVVIKLEAGILNLPRESLARKFHPES